MSLENKLNLLFDEETHVYSIDGRKIPSVTKILETVLFESKYDNIDPEVLRAAAERGSLIHKEISDYILTNEQGFTLELLNFIKLTLEKKIKWLETEEKVTDGDIAGTFDLMGKIGKKTFLADIKTTYKLDKEYVSWQLSIYAYIIEKIYPEIKIDEFYALWLRDEKCRFDKVERKTDEQVLKVLEAFKNGVKIKIEPTSLQTIPEDKIMVLCNALEQMKKMEESIKEIKEKIFYEMESRGIPKVDLGSVTISYTSPSVSNIVDTQKLKDDGIYDNYKKQSVKKGSITIKVKE